MTTVSRFSRQNDLGLRALNVVLWENLVIVVVLVLESKALYYLDGWDQQISPQKTTAETPENRKFSLNLRHPDEER